MGLDMYLRGKKHVFRHRDFPDTPPPEQDGFRVIGFELDMGYWRKHPNLHGYIVQNFAVDGKDDCRPVGLTADNLRQIRDAVIERTLPHTSGFFFGTSATPEDEWYERQLEYDIKTLSAAIDWLEAPPPTDQIEMREVYYEASW